MAEVVTIHRAKRQIQVHFGDRIMTSDPESISRTWFPVLGTSYLLRERQFSEEGEATRD